MTKKVSTTRKAATVVPAAPLAVQAGTTEAALPAATVVPAAPLQVRAGTTEAPRLFRQDLYHVPVTKGSSKSQKKKKFFDQRITTRKKTTK